MSHPLPHPECPRCGYDLSGTSASWAESCPTTGVCSECGLEFEWRLVMTQGLASWLWFIESAGKRLQRACVITTWRALHPGRFWRDVSLEARVVPARVARWAVVTFGVLFLALAVCVGAGACVNAAFSTRRIVWTPANPAAGIFPRPRGLGPVIPSSITPRLLVDAVEYDVGAAWSSGGWLPPHGPTGLLWALGASAMAPVVVLALPHTRSRAKVRGAHILRAAAYGFAWLAPFCVVSLVVRLIELGYWTLDTIGNPPLTTSPWSKLNFHTPLGFSIMHGGAATITAVIIGVWLGFYWAMVLRRGWRMRGKDSLPAVLSMYVCMFLGGHAFAFWVGDLV